MATDLFITTTRPASELQAVPDLFGARIEVACELRVDRVGAQPSHALLEMSEELLAETLFASRERALGLLQRGEEAPFGGPAQISGLHDPDAPERARKAVWFRAEHARLEAELQLAVDPDHAGARERLVWAAGQGSSMGAPFLTIAALVSRLRHDAGDQSARRNLRDVLASVDSERGFGVPLLSEAEALLG